MRASTSTNRARPTKVDLKGDRALSVSAGARNTCVTLRSGRLACWGANASGQVGNGMPSAIVNEPAFQSP